ncbi:hypothetical protein [Roseivirga sp.]|uniref:hypothetical protein n=1 Tax=Roseivirga sp. TaxID=1964215 RepID=UPI003B8ADEF7
MDSNFRGLTINIIYVKGTVDLLLPFLSTLLQFSECRFRLVSNACPANEEAQLKQFVITENRTSFYSLESYQVLLHHEVLHRLLAKEQSEWFAFMDSDIFAKGSFLPEMMYALKDKDAVFTGLPLWHEDSELKMPQKFKIMGGRYFMSHNDCLLGLSYMAIYRTGSLRHFIKSTGVDFRRYYWKEIPALYQDIISKAGLRKHMYDTAKVLNILWQDQGARMVYHPVDNLIHLGGVSGEDNQGGLFLAMKRNLLRLIPALISTSVKSMFGISDRISFQERLNIERLVKKRRISAMLLRQRLYSSSVGSDMQMRHFLGSEIAQKFETAIEIIDPVIKEFYQNRSKK